MKKELLRMEHVFVKKWGRYALEDFHLNIYEDEFVFLYGFADSGIAQIGEILKGNQEVHNGTFYLEDRKVSSSSFSDPGHHGIYIIQNENNLVESLSIAENLFFGGNKKYFRLVVSRQKQEMMAKRLLRQFGFEIDIRTNVYRLDYFQRIILKIIMAYAKGAKLVVFDDIIGIRGMKREHEKVIINALNILRDDGISVLWLNQRIDAIREMADRMVVIGKGRNMRSFYRGYDEQLVEFMSDLYPVKKRTSEIEAVNTGKTILSMRGISSSGLKNFHMDIKEGEAIWICAHEVNLLKDWRDIVCGEKHDYSGEMYLEGKKYEPQSYTECVENGVIFLDLMWPEQHGNDDISIVDNMLIEGYWQEKPMMGLIDKGKREFFKNRYRMKHPGWPVDYWRNLTGEQQKILLLEKAALRPHKLVIITQPFFQLNDSSTEEFVRLVNEIKETNKAVVFTSISDRDSRLIADKVVYLDQPSSSSI